MFLPCIFDYKHFAFTQVSTKQKYLEGRALEKPNMANFRDQRKKTLVLNIKPDEVLAPEIKIRVENVALPNAFVLA